jgi:hypothetical protein
MGTAATRRVRGEMCRVEVDTRVLQSAKALDVEVGERLQRQLLSDSRLPPPCGGVGERSEG